MRSDVLVIGGGPAGAAAAIGLAWAGVPVTLVERERAPAHKVCGEFLSGEALHYLQRLGVDVARLGAVPLHTVRLAGHGDVVQRTLPFAAMSLTRRTLDQALLCRAESAGVQVLRGCQVERLSRADGGWQASLAGGASVGDSVGAKHVFLATGKHDLRGYPRGAGKQQGMIAFKMYWRLSRSEAASLGKAVELVTYAGGYAGLQPVEGGVANLCCLVRAAEFRSLGGTWPNLVTHMCAESPHLRKRLAGAEPQLQRPLTIASLPYGFVRAESDGLWYLGDQAVVIPSFTGDGMALALHTGVLAADLYIAGEIAVEYQRQVAQQVQRQVALATALSRAMVRSPRLSLLLPTIWPGALSLIARRTRIAPCFLRGCAMPLQAREGVAASLD